MEKETLFNELRKNAFIEDRKEDITNKGSLIISYGQFFKQSAPYERRFNKDLCQFNAVELREYMEGTAGLRDGSKTKQISMLKNYFAWCESALKIPVSNAIKEVSVTGIAKIRRSMVANPRGLQSVLDLYYDPVDMKTVDNIYRCFFWLAFAGVDEEDIMGVKCKDVDTDNRTLIVNGEVFYIEQEAVPALKIASTLPLFMYYHPNYKPVYKERSPGDTLIRGFSAPSLSTVRNLISTRSRASAYKFPEGEEVRLTHYRVWLSGQFYRIRKKEIEGIEPDFTELARHYVSGKAYENDKEIAHTAMVREKRNYRTDYERWKIAFQL